MSLYEHQVSRHRIYSGELFNVFANQYLAVLTNEQGIRGNQAIRPAPHLTASEKIVYVMYFIRDVIARRRQVAKAAKN